MSVHNASYAIYSENSYGPNFGLSFNDLSFNQADLHFGYSFIGPFYQIPTFLDPTRYNSFLAGFQYFEIIELEVYAST